MQILAEIPHLSEVRLLLDPKAVDDTTYLLLDLGTNRPRLSIAANYLTALARLPLPRSPRKYLAPADASTRGIFGTGALSRTHLAVLPLVRNVQTSLVTAAKPIEFAKPD